VNKPRHPPLFASPRLSNDSPFLPLPHLPLPHLQRPLTESWTWKLQVPSSALYSFDLSFLILALLKLKEASKANLITSSGLMNSITASVATGSMTLVAEAGETMSSNTTALRMPGLTMATW
jgi:hypothetical protein